MQKTSLLEGEKSGTRRNKVFRTHGFRKTVTTKMVQAGVSDFAIEKLLGHKSKNITSKHYYRPEEEVLLAEYLKAVDLLTIDEENRLKRKVQQLELDVTEIQAFKKELDDLKDLFFKDKNNNK